MATKKTIAIIGASGKMGAVITKSLSKGADRLLLMSEEPEKLNVLAQELKLISPNADFEIMGCAFHATWEADVIILAVPYRAEKEVAEKIKEVATGKVVISIAKPLNDPFTGLSPRPVADELQKLLPHSKVIKVINTTCAEDFDHPLMDGKTVDAFITDHYN